MGNEQGFARQQEINPADMGWNGAVCTAARDGSWFSADGYNHIVLEVHFTRVAATGNLVLRFEYRKDSSDTAMKPQTGALSAGTYTLTDEKYSKATGSASLHITIPKDLNCAQMRVSLDAAITAATTDTLTITGRLGVIPS